MLNKKQAADLLQYSATFHRQLEPLLEAVYSGADSQTKQVLDKHPDLRAKLRHINEAEITVKMQRNDMRKLVLSIINELDPIQPGDVAHCADDACEDSGDVG